MGKPLTLEQALELKEGDKIFTADDRGGWALGNLTVSTIQILYKIGETDAKLCVDAALAAVGAPADKPSIDRAIRAVMKASITDILITADDRTQPIKNRAGEILTYAGTGAESYTTYSLECGESNKEPPKQQ